MNEKYDGYTITFSNSNGYPSIHVNGKNVLLHRYVWMKYHGEIPKGFQVHHKDGNKLNWNIDNLEMICASEHQRMHAFKNELGRNNKGKMKKHQSGFAPIHHPVVLKKNGEIKYFPSMTAAKNFLGLKGTNSIANVLSGRSKTAKGWIVCDVK